MVEHNSQKPTGMTSFGYYKRTKIRKLKSYWQCWNFQVYIILRFTSFCSGSSLTSVWGVVSSTTGAGAAVVAGVKPSLPRGEMLIRGPGLRGRAPPPILSRGLKPYREYHIWPHVIFYLLLYRDYEYSYTSAYFHDYTDTSHFINQSSSSSNVRKDITIYNNGLNRFNYTLLLQTSNY